MFRPAFLPLLMALIAFDTQAQNSEGNRPTGLDFATRSPVVAQNGMAATSQPLASQIALDILKAGGSAVDAAIAANAALGLMEPTGNGIGGDLFAIVWDPESGRLHGLNASGRSPMGLSLEELRRAVGDAETIPLWGALPVSVPGTVDGWFELHEAFGRLPMAEVLAPAIRYARGGFPVSQIIAHAWQMNLDRFAANRAQIEEFDNFLATWTIDGRAPGEGEIFRNPDLARTYELIAEGGRDAFYRGPIARTIDAYMRRIGGYLRYEDLAAHTSGWDEPVSVNYRGYDVYELPPPGQGIAALQMLNILEHYDLAATGFGSADYLHLHAEAKKLAFEDRARYYVDPAFVDVPLEGLLSKEYAAQRRRLIDPQRAGTDYGFGEPRGYAGDTIYLTVADGSGMMVSLIQSNYVGMGGGLVPDGLGFVLQDRGALFALADDHPNVYAPGKLPFHTIIPAFVMKDGEPYMSFGVMGGDMQPQGHVQVFINHIDFGMNIQEAGDAPRYRHTGSSEPTGEGPEPGGGRLFLEAGFSTEVIEELRRRGHDVRVTPGTFGFGGYQAILWDRENRVFHGASEMRKDGAVAAY
jgi:gamma-glutamyltranspeptidase / glutathione hydrolase